MGHPYSDFRLRTLVQSLLRGKHSEIACTATTFVSMMLGWLLTRLPESDTLTPNLFYSLSYLTGSIYGLRKGLHSLIQKRIDVDLLMILAAAGAAIIGAPFEGAMLLFLFSLSNVLQAYAIDRTRNALRTLMKLRPEEAIVRRSGIEVTIPVDKIVIGDHIVVRPGTRIALDGLVVKGDSTVDQASLTGESIPIHKYRGDPVFAGTINMHGSLEIRVNKLSTETAIAKLIQMVEEAQSEKAGTQRFVDKAEQYYAAGVIAMTVLAITVPTTILGETFPTAFYRAMNLMVASSPCALVISTPAVVLSAIGNGARRGILFKGGAYVEQAASIRAMVFDKTGTLTLGKPEATDVVTIPASRSNFNQMDLLSLAAAAESHSEHPLAKAVVRAANEHDLVISSATKFRSDVGLGVRAIVGGKEIRVGNLRYFSKFTGRGLRWAKQETNRLHQEGKTSLTVVRVLRKRQVEVLGIIGVADVLRPDAATVVSDLKSIGVERIVMLTGDNRTVASQIATQAGVDEYYAEMLPEDKVCFVKEMRQEYGTVAMVGDGVNDAPALATASIGIAMGAAGTDVALETSDIVLMSDDLNNIPYLMELSHMTRRTLVANLSFALATIALLIAGILAVSLPLPLSVVGHEGGTVLVCLNSLRLLAFKRKVRLPN